MLLSTAGLCVAAQRSGGRPECPTAYEYHNQVDPLPLRVSNIRGTSIIQFGDGQTQPAVPGACYTLFTEGNGDGHALVSTVRAGTDGRFEFAGVRPGLYRLVARADGFCPANVPIKVVRYFGGNREIVVHFCLAAIDICSFGDLRKPAAAARSAAPAGSRR